MLELLFKPFTDVRDFMETGGPVLWGVLLAAVLLWTLIIERYWYLRVVHPAEMGKAVRRWQARRDTTSWYAKRIREAMISQVSLKLGQYLPLIKSLIAVCPLLGLLGTVSGMIHVFDVMAITGSGNVRGMAEGISRATIPTMSGLIVALSGLLFSARLNHHAKEEADKLADQLRHY